MVKWLNSQFLNNFNFWDNQILNMVLEQVIMSSNPVFTTPPF